jgi:hypothetical protein
MDATAHTLPTFLRFDAKMLNAVAKLIGQGASPNWNLAEAGVSASIPEDAGPRLQNESLASD